jgi:hypothetical protein
MSSSRKRLLLAFFGISFLGLFSACTYTFWWYPHYGFDYDEIQVAVTDAQSNPVPDATIQLQYGVIIPIPSPQRSRATTDVHGVARIRVARNLDCEFLMLSAKLPGYSPMDGYGFASVEIRQSDLISAEKGSCEVLFRYLNGAKVPDTKCIFSFRKNGQEYTR